MKKVIAILFMGTLSACSSGGGGSGSQGAGPKLGNPGGSTANGGPGATVGGTTYTHAQLAQQFVTALNIESAQLLAQGEANCNTSSGANCDNFPDVTFVVAKVNTQQSGYIIVASQSADPTYAGQYTAIYVDGWTPSMDPVKDMGFGSSPANSFINIGSIGNGQYQDSASGTVFEVAQPTAKDLQKLAAFKQAYLLKKYAANAQKKFGVTLERGVEVAKLAIQVQNNPHMNNADYDNLSQQLLGVPLAKLDSTISKFSSGSDASDDVNSIINSAAATNGVGPEEARALVNSFSGQ